MRHPFHVALLAAVLAAHGAGSSSAADRRDRGQAGVLLVPSEEAAISLALQRSPALNAAEAGVAASRGNLVQAGLPPNPEIGVTAENVTGSGQYRSARSLEMSYELAQRLEIGGQRPARVGVARSEVVLAGRDFEAVRLDLVREARRTFAEAVAARRGLRIASDSLRLAQDTLSAVQELVRAGREPLLQQRQAEVAVSSAIIARQRAEREVEITRRALATVLAAQAVQIGNADRWFEDIGGDPVRRLPTDPSANPDYARLNEEIERARRALTLERRRAIPDVTVGGGIRRYSETNDTVLLLGLSVPLPIFDRNQGNIARASADLTRAEATADLYRRTIGANLAEVGQRLELAWREANTLRQVVLPAAEQAYSLAREGYAAGRFTFLETLVSQRALFDARAQLNAALRDYHVRRAEADRIAGRSSPASVSAPGARQ